MSKDATPPVNEDEARPPDAADGSFCFVSVGVARGRGRVGQGGRREPARARGAARRRRLEAYAGKEADSARESARAGAPGHAARHRRPLDGPPLEMDYLREGIGLRAVGQRDPLVEYKRRPSRCSAGSSASSTRTFCARSCTSSSIRETAPVAPKRGVAYSAPTEDIHLRRSRQAGRRERRRSLLRGDGTGRRDVGKAGAAPGAATVVKDKEDPWADVGRNDPCPCGSGKKYKKCHGANA